MPAVELDRLRGQIQELISRFAYPEEFRRAFDNLLDLYADHAYRPGQVVKPQPLLPSYRVPQLVLRLLENELVRTARARPDEALEVAEALWNDTHLEPRRFAALMVGAIPATHSDAVAEKLRAWAVPSVNFRILDLLFEHTTVLRTEAPDRLLTLAGEWLSSSDPEVQAIGLQALYPFIVDPEFENLPPIYSMLSPLVQNIPGPIHANVSSTIEALARRNSAETAYFLRQALSLSNNPNTARMIRRCLPLFEPQQQAGLRAAMRSSDNT